MPSTDLTTQQQAILKFRNDPVLFVRNVLGLEPDEWQIEFLNAVRDNNRVSVRSGHGVGKSTAIAWACLWLQLFWFPVKVAIVGSSLKQLNDTVWPEIGANHRKLPDFLKQQLVITSERMVLKSNPDESFTTVRAGNVDNPEALQGLHGENMYVFFDEASGIHDSVYEASRGAMSTRGATVVMTSNPTRLTGYFYESQLEDRENLWTKIAVSCLDSKLVDESYSRDIELTHGKESNFYRVRVLGEFPKDEDDVLIPREWVKNAVGREVDVYPHSPIVWGLDVARFGDDSSALAKRKGNHVLEPIKTWTKMDLMQLCDAVAKEYLKTPDNEKPQEILVDVIGIGGGVKDRLSQLGFPVSGINVSEKPYDADQFPRLRDELWWKCREWFSEKDSVIPDDDRLMVELTTPLFDIDGNGRVKVESKKEMKKRGKKSPDTADALCLTFAVSPKQVEFEDYEINTRWVV